MAVPVVGIDLDGVLVDFNVVFLGLLSLSSGKKYTSDQVTNYSYAKCLEGVSKDALDATYKLVPNIPNFWENLPPLNVPGVIAAQELSELSHLYAVTARWPVGRGMRDIKSKTMLAQSERWLRQRDINVMGVIKSRSGMQKGPTVYSLGCAYFLEDSPESYLSCREFGVNVFLMDAPYNRHIDTERRLYSVREYVDMIKADL